MNYTLIGHGRDNAVHDLLICLLPDEEHKSADSASEGDACRSFFERQGTLAVSVAEVSRGGRQTTGRCEKHMDDLSLEGQKRAASYAVKTALYRALLPHLSQNPPWGSLTGVKPGKAVRAAVARGLSWQSAPGYLMDEYFVEPLRADMCSRASRVAYDIGDTVSGKEVQLYAGIPFCPGKCAYCSFVSNDVARWGDMIAPYLDALIAEIKAAGEAAASARLDIGSVYIGGGTPTILTAAQLDRLLASLSSSFHLPPGIEFTVEAGRPDTIDADKLAVLAARHVGRISINPQTMNDSVLGGVRRAHTAADVERVYKMARGLGSFAINMDLIAGLPGDTPQGLIGSVKKLVGLSPENITIHCMARKRGAPLFFGESGDLPQSALDGCYDMLFKAGYEPYYIYRQKYIAGALENIGFCKPGFASRYNIIMMEELGDVMSLGCGGVTKLGTRSGGKITRRANPKYPREYILGIDEVCLGKRQLV